MAELVIPNLHAFYTRVKQFSRATWSAEQVARAELHWWVLRRQRDQNTPEIVGLAMASFYQLLHGKTNKCVKRAGLLRARAAYTRDRQSFGSSIDWQLIELLLVQSYTQLIKGVLGDC